MKRLTKNQIRKAFAYCVSIGYCKYDDGIFVHHNDGRKVSPQEAYNLRQSKEVLRRADLMREGMTQCKKFKRKVYNSQNSRDKANWHHYSRIEGNDAYLD